MVITTFLLRCMYGPMYILRSTLNIRIFRETIHKNFLFVATAFKKNLCNCAVLSTDFYRFLASAIERIFFPLILSLETILSRKERNIIGHYKPLVRIINLVFHTAYVVCLIIYIKGVTYSLKSTANDRFFEKIFVIGF